jgi:hypothetical protein
MPSLRDSGKLVGRSASLRQVARQCHLPFPLSLRQFIRTPGCPFTRCNRLHIKVLTNPTIPIETMLNRMREVYSTAGIRVEVVSRENLTGPTFTNLLDLDVPQDAQGNPCPAGQTSNEHNQLFMNRNNVGDNEIVIYFVRSTVPALNGCASFPNGQPGAVVTQNASLWTLAHEVSHVLGLSHIAGEHQGCPTTNPQCCSTPNFTRLMTGCGTGNITGTPTVDQNEINTMTGNNLTRQC